MLEIPSKENTPDKIRRYLGFEDNIPKDISTLISDSYKKSRYTNRNKTEFIYDNSVSFPEWFKKFSVEINDGKIEKCPFPLEIEIYLSNNDLGTEIPKYINFICDTKGLDSTDGDRIDVQQMLKDENCISIFCDKIDTFGSNANINYILRQIVINENKDINHRVFCVV